jgi:hypothetical protein
MRFPSIRYPGESAVCISSTARSITMPSLLKLFQKPIKILNAIIDHEGGATRIEIFRIARKQRSNSVPALFRLLGIAPVEGHAAFTLRCETEMPLVPGAKLSSVIGLEEDSADACYSLHAIRARSLSRMLMAHAECLVVISLLTR